jgi:hypothetical protein
MKPTTTQTTKPKGKVEEGSSVKTNSPGDNTRKVAASNKPSRISAVPKRPRRTTTMPRTKGQEDAIKGDTSQTGEERVQVTGSGVQPSQTKRKTI